jgi:hypothetical protein
MEKEEVKLNNPGNMIKGALLYIGEKPESSDNLFREFYDIRFGYRAMFKELQTFISLGYRSIKQIVTRWAQMNANRTKDYIEFVSTNIGVSSDMSLDLTDKDTLIQLVCAISHYETGHVPNIKEVEEGYGLIGRKFV